MGLFMNCGGTVGVLPKWRRQCQETSGVASRVFRTFQGSKGKVGFLSRRRCAKGPHIGLRGEFPGVSRVSTGNLGFLSSYDSCCLRKVKSPYELRGVFLDSSPVDAWGRCPHLELRPELQDSSPVLT